MWNFKSQMVNIGNQAYEIMFNQLMPGFKLDSDPGLKALLKAGYENNTTVFGIAMKIAIMFASIPVKAFKGEKEIDNPLIDLFEQNAADQTYFEHNVMWEIFGLMAGESIVYYKKFDKGGNDDDQLASFDIMPPQNTVVESKGWRQPVGKYRFDLDGERHYIDPDNIWHTRLFPNLFFEGGKNFRGLSPLRVARLLIETSNGSDELMSNSLNSGLPPGILVEKGKQQSTGIQKNKLINIWRKKYATRKNKAEPIVTETTKDGGIEWIPMGFSNFRDLQVIEGSEHGLRKLCSVWSVPSRLFNDPKGASYNNKKQDDKDIYTNRIIPDMDARITGYDKIFKETGITFKADYSQIEALQEDSKDVVARMTVGYDRGLVEANEWRVSAGLEAKTPEEIEAMRLEYAESRGIMPVTNEEQKELIKRIYENGG